MAYFNLKYNEFFMFKSGPQKKKKKKRSSHLLEWLLSKGQEITSIGEDVEKRET